MSESFKMPKWWSRARDRKFIVGIDLSIWFFPEWDQWKLSLRRRGPYLEPNDYFLRY